MTAKLGSSDGAPNVTPVCRVLSFRRPTAGILKNHGQIDHDGLWGYAPSVDMAIGVHAKPKHASDVAPDLMIPCLQAKQEKETVEHAVEAAAKQPRVFWSEGDPLRAKYGPARLSHPGEFERVITELREAGTEIDFRPGTLAYSPEKGGPGRIIFDPDGSVAALRHEMRHFRDVRDAGYPGLGAYLANPRRYWEMEFRAYMEEIRFARSMRDYESAREILIIMRRVKSEILGELP